MSDTAPDRIRTPSGAYRDVLLGPNGESVWERPWQGNLIVAGMSRLLAALIKGDAQGRPISHWAVGTGEEAWDDLRAPAVSDAGWTRLRNESARREIDLSVESQIRFLGGDFTHRLEIATTFTTEDIEPGEHNANWRLREFALFAGGGAERDSGVMINHRIHPRIDMQPGFTLQRTLHLTF